MSPLESRALMCTCQRCQAMPYREGSFSSLACATPTGLLVLEASCATRDLDPSTPPSIGTTGPETCLHQPPTPTGSLGRLPEPGPIHHRPRPQRMNSWWSSLHQNVWARPYIMRPERERNFRLRYSEAITCLASTIRPAELSMAAQQDRGSLKDRPCA